jgi:hypothetical protein
MLRQKSGVALSPEMKGVLASSRLHSRLSKLTLNLSQITETFADEW